MRRIVPKGGVDIRGRLQRAALELFRENGYDRTTTVEIAARAEVTERTLFRHFADKREILFDGEAKLRGAMTEVIASVPASLGPLDTLLAVFRSTIPMIEANRPFAEPRHHVIAATPALQERELAKHSSLAGVMADALQARGVERRAAALAAQTAMVAFVEATLAWFEEPQQGLGAHLEQTFAMLRELSKPRSASSGMMQTQQASPSVGARRRNE